MKILKKVMQTYCISNDWLQNDNVAPEWNTLEKVVHREGNKKADSKLLSSTGLS